MKENNQMSGNISEELNLDGSKQNNETQENKETTAEWFQILPRNIRDPSKDMTKSTEAFSEEKECEEKSADKTVESLVVNKHKQKVSTEKDDTLLELDVESFKNEVPEDTVVMKSVELFPVTKKQETMLSLTSSSQERPVDIIKGNSKTLTTKMQEIENDKRRILDFIDKDVNRVEISPCENVIPTHTPQAVSVNKDDTMSDMFLIYTEPGVLQNPSFPTAPLLFDEIESKPMETREVSNLDLFKEKPNQESATENLKLTNKKSGRDSNQNSVPPSVKAGEKSDKTVLQKRGSSAPKKNSSILVNALEDLSLKSHTSLLPANQPSPVDDIKLEQCDTKVENEEKMGILRGKTIFQDITKQDTDTNKPETLPTLNTKEAILDEVQILMHAQLPMSKLHLL